MYSFKKHQMARYKMLTAAKHYSRCGSLVHNEIGMKRVLCPGCGVQVYRKGLVSFTKDHAWQREPASQGSFVDEGGEMSS